MGHGDIAAPAMVVSRRELLQNRHAARSGEDVLLAGRLPPEGHSEEKRHMKGKQIILTGITKPLRPTSCSDSAAHSRKAMPADRTKPGSAGLSIR